MNQQLVAVNTIMTQTGGYYMAIDRLSHRDTSELTTETQAEHFNGDYPQMSLVVYAPLVIFAVLFVSAYLILAAFRIRSFHRLTTMLILVIFAASVPFVLNSIQNGISFMPKASNLDIPHNIEISQTDQSSLSVQWLTDDWVYGAVKYCQKPCSLDGAIVKYADNGIQTKRHRTILTGLIQSADYQFIILSGTRWFDNNGLPLEFRLTGN
ncbi:hypothetical protein A2154_03165 [Candidatus Gottesmanbacteria bacterium RBG_16_43_7]|uniref:Fibronectin type-III domain-containing protein n=1 Tax=Candidatus Gottesmanbacteria bacterium RBG_16_43_7 TaxID=1798373 RepID=A0A1F5ZA07_9BACT|nr:MAG: hypothetical protein A2154_03165 [Candidatus Gottesmanbacteria bacterium RBG_16_43_7]